MTTLPAYIDPEAWAGFVEMRRAMPKSRPFTHRAAVLILAELQRIKDAGHDASAALDQSTLRGWADVYVPVDKPIAKITPVESTEMYVARVQTERALGKARVTKPPQAIKDLLGALK